MDLLITLIGNAVVDPDFRDLFLRHPADTADKYGFRLTKSDFELMQQVFGSIETLQQEKDPTFVALQDAFVTLENAFYARVLQTKCPRPCVMSLYPPPHLRAEIAKLREERRAREVKEKESHAA